MHPTHKRLSRRFRLLQALVNGDVLEAARSVVEYKQVRAPVQQRIFSVLPRSIAPTVEQGTRCAKTLTPALMKVGAPSGPQNGEKRKRVDDENSVESLSSAPILMERPRKQLKVALSTIAEVARLNCPKTGQKRKNMEDESSVNISKSASTAEETTNKRVKFDIAATTAGTSLDQKSEEVSKKLQEDVSLKRAQFPSTTTGSIDQLKDAESLAATTSVSLDPDESREVPEPTTSINTSKSAYATVQRAIEQLKASMPVDIDTSASRYLDIETNLRTELLKLLDGMNPGASVDPPLTELIKETSQKRGSTEAATLEPQMLHTHGTPAHILKSDAIENQSLSPLMAGDGVAPKIYNYKRKRDPTSDGGHPDVRQDMNDAPEREETEQSIQHQSFPKLVIGEWLQDDRPPGSPRVIINGCPPPRKKRSSNNSVTALAEGPSPHALARKDRNTEELRQRVPTTEANVEDFKTNFLRRSEQSKARIAPSDIDSTVPAREEPKDVDEAIERWFAAVQKKRDAESRREARKKRREIQVRQAEFRAQQRDLRPVRCSRNLSEAFQRLLQSKRRINNLPAEYGAEVGAKVRLDVSISAMDSTTDTSLVDRVI